MRLQVLIYDLKSELRLIFLCFGERKRNQFGPEGAAEAPPAIPPEEVVCPGMITPPPPEPTPEPAVADPVAPGEPDASSLPSGSSTTAPIILPRPEEGRTGQSLESRKGVNSGSENGANSAPKVARLRTV